MMYKMHLYLLVAAVAWSGAAVSATASSPGDASADELFPLDGTISGRRLPYEERSHDRSCKDNKYCDDLGLTGQCCPTPDDVWLDCCGWRGDWDHDEDGT